MNSVQAIRSARNGGMKRLVMSVALITFASACSAEVSIGGSPDLDSESAALMVNAEFEDLLGFGPLETRCAVPNDLVEGDVFTCTSETGDGDVLQWSAVATSDSEASIRSENLLNDETVEELEAAAVDALAAEGVPIVVDDLDCGPGALILGADNELVCALTDTSTGDVYDATITIQNMEDLQFDVVIADAPR